jgi:hypothetical protein
MNIYADFIQVLKIRQLFIWHWNMLPKEICFILLGKKNFLVKIQLSIFLYKYVQGYIIFINKD